MSTTEKLYYEKPEIFSCEARVIAVHEAPGVAVHEALELDRTIFYPEGGGQACDLGTISALDGSAARTLASVEESEGRILHRLAARGEESRPFKEGDRVRLLVDRARRIDYSQQHTAEHLIGATALRLVGARVLSVHFGPDRSLIDFDLPSISDEDLAAVEDEVDRIIADDYPIRTHLCPPEDIASFPLRRKAPEGEEELRVVEIDGIDFSPCCGLHRASTGELRAIRLFGSEKYKGMCRVYFAAGGRATADYRSVSRIARESARILGTSEAELAEAVLRESSRRKEAESSVGALERERAAYEAASAPERSSGGGAASADGGVASRARLAIRRYPDRGASSLMTTAKAFAEAGMVAILVSAPDLTVQALSPSAESRLGEKLKGPLSASGGKGGGGPANFRAVFADAGSLEAFLEEARKTLGD
jgi:alanyl-tRNA synthetase